MILNIKSITDDSLDCLEKSIVSIAQCWGCDYELMFSKSWTFSFLKIKPSTLSSIGSRIFLENDEKFSLLEQYHGIRVLYNKIKNIDETFNSIKTELYEGRPVCIDMDLFWCPWRKGEYQLKSEQQLCMVIGIDEFNNIYCIDLGRLDNIDCVEYISQDHFLKGCTALSTYSLTEKNREIDWFTILNEAVVNFKVNSDGFLSIQDFASNISNIVDFKYERQGSEDVNKIQLFVRLNDIAFRHIKFSKTIKYLADMFNIGRLYELSSDMCELGWQWRTIRGMILKAFYMKDPTKILNRASEKIINIVKFEDDIACNLLNINKRNL